MPICSRAALVALLLASTGACKPAEPVTLSTPLKIVDVECSKEFLEGLNVAVIKDRPEDIMFEFRGEGSRELRFLSGRSREALTTYSRSLPPPGAPAGAVLVYEDQNGGELPPWRMYCVEAEGLTLRRVAGLERGADSVKLVLEAADAKALASFSGERIGRPVAFVVGDEALAVAIVEEQLSQQLILSGPHAVALLK